MHRHISRRVVHRATSAVCKLVVAGTLFVATDVSRGAGGEAAASPVPMRTEFRAGGVIEESYAYHRQQPMRMAGAARSVEPVGGWYGYGFPVSTFRWGWFGAAHYYPTVGWHDGYYGDCCRYGYRRGY